MRKIKPFVLTALATAAVIGLVSSTSQGVNTPPPTPQTVLVWGNIYQGQFTVPVWAAASSPGAPEVAAGANLAEIDATLRGMGFHVTHISDNQLYRSYEK